MLESCFNFILIYEMYELWNIMITFAALKYNTNDRETDIRYINREC